MKSVGKTIEDIHIKIELEVRGYQGIPATYSVVVRPDENNEDDTENVARFSRTSSYGFFAVTLDIDGVLHKIIFDRRLNYWRIERGGLVTESRYKSIFGMLHALGTKSSASFLAIAFISYSVFLIVGATLIFSYSVFMDLIGQSIVKDARVSSWPIWTGIGLGFLGFLFVSFEDQKQVRLGYNTRECRKIRRVKDT